MASPAAGKKGMARNIALVKEQLTAGEPYGKDVNSRGTTNDGRLTPSFKEDTPKAVREDVEKIKKGLNGPAKNEGIRDSQKLSGMRAGSRMGFRGIGLAGAGEIGAYLGDKIKEANDADIARRREAEDMQREAAKYGVRGIEQAFKKGGAVKKSSTKMRGVGIAQKGVRKAKMY